MFLDPCLLESSSMAKLSDSSIHARFKEVSLLESIKILEGKRSVMMEFKEQIVIPVNVADLLVPFGLNL